MNESQTYDEIVSACVKFQQDRRVEPLEKWISQARLYDYGFRSLVGSLEVIREKVQEACIRTLGEDKWYLTQVLNQLDQLDMLRQLEVPNDFRAITVHFAFHHNALSSIKANLERACAISDHGLEQTLQNLVKSIKAVTDGNGLFLANWKEPEEWSTLYVPDVGLKVVKLIYANRHSMNLAAIPSRVGTHRHADTSEVHFSLDPTDGDQIVGCFRLHVTEPYAVPIKPSEWHAYEENRTSRPHQLLFLTGSKRILGWGIVIDRIITESSKLNLMPLDIEEIDRVGGVLIERAVQDVESHVSNEALQKQLITASSSGGITLGLVAIPHMWKSHSQDVIHLVVKGTGELTVLNNKTKIKDGDVFAIPSGMVYEVSNQERRPLILLSSTLQD